MATEIKLPDLGEGIEDVTISRWRVKEGDEVKAGDVILEVATDKVDQEVTAPADGKLLKINFKEGELAPVSAALGAIGADDESVSANGGNASEAGTPAREPDAPATPGKEPLPIGEEAPAAEKRPAPEEAPGPGDAHQPAASENGQEVRATPVAKRIAAEQGISLSKVTGTGPNGQITKEDVLGFANGATSAPAAPPEKNAGLPGDLADVASLSVRRLAADHNINLAEIAQGRPLSALTRYDVMRAANIPFTEELVAPPEPVVPPTAPAQPAAAKPATPSPAPAAQPGAGEELIKHSRMRQAIARNTSQSIFTAPHVTTMWDVDMTAVLAHRKANKKEFEKAGVNLTVTAYLIEGALAGLRTVPAANATWTDEGVIIKRYYNIGMATSLPMDANGMGGLIVPVIKNAGDLNLIGIARAVNELAEKARANKLSNEDLQGGTFTLSNYGTSGSRFQTPVIVQPQVGILGTGAIEKRPVVVSNGSPLEANMGDYLTFKPVMTLGFSYDHRVLDGATADAYCAAVKKALENWK